MNIMASMAIMINTVIRTMTITVTVLLITFLLMVLLMDPLTVLLMDPLTDLIQAMVTVLTTHPSGSVPKKRKTSSYLSPITIPFERKSSFSIAEIMTETLVMLASTLPPHTLLVLDSITSLLFRLNRNGKGLLVCQPLDLMRTSMKLVHPNLSPGYTTVWASWESGSIPYILFTGCRKRADE
jgi:hypothetical protein